MNKSEIRALVERNRELLSFKPIELPSKRGPKIATEKAAIKSIQIQPIKPAVEKSKPIHPKRAELFQTILQSVCDFYGAWIDEVKGTTRRPLETWARQVAITLCMEVPHASYSEVGRFFVHRDHCQVIKATKRVKNRMETEPAISQEIQRLRETLNDQKPGQIQV